MPRGRKNVKEIELECCTLRMSANEFCRHNKINGLSNAIRTILTEREKEDKYSFIKEQKEDLDSKF